MKEKDEALENSIKEEFSKLLFNVKFRDKVACKTLIDLAECKFKDMVKSDTDILTPNIVDTLCSSIQCKEISEDKFSATMTTEFTTRSGVKFTTSFIFDYVDFAQYNVADTSDIDALFNM